MKLAVVCHNIRSVHNVGSIFRTADAAGIEKIYLCGITPSPVDRFRNVRPDFAKVSLGAEEYVPWESIAGTEEIIEALRKDHWRILALEQSKESIPYYDFLTSGRAETMNDKFALVLGPEVEGLPGSILKIVDKIIEIPMFGKKESLNVAVAFGIAVFGLRQAGISGQ